MESCKFSFTFIPSRSQHIPQLRASVPIIQQPPSMDSLANPSIPMSFVQWTPILHDRFLFAIRLLGGENRATPTLIHRVMGIEFLSVSHIKGHLLMYKNVKQAKINKGEAWDARLPDEYYKPHYQGGGEHTKKKKKRRVSTGNTSTSVGHQCHPLHPQGKGKEKHTFVNDPAMGPAANGHRPIFINEPVPKVKSAEDDDCELSLEYPPKAWKKTMLDGKFLSL